MTPLDSAHQAMEAAPEDDRARLAYYEAFATAEITLLLAEEPAGEVVRPQLFETAEGPLALAFDGEDRLAAFAEGPAPYATLPGRALAGLLAGKGIGLGLNFPEGPAAFLMPAEALDWLTATLAQAPEPRQDRPARLAPPDLPEALLAALDRRLARAEGLARRALLAQAEWPDGSAGPFLALVGALPGAETALAQAIGEALTFTGLDAGTLDITFLAPEDPLIARLETIALALDLPQAPKPAGPVAPGMDPDRPPNLR